MNDPIRRPLKVRGVKLVNDFAQFLNRRNISPNSISIMSVVFAIFSAICFISFSQNNQFWLLILAALFIQCRLLCNLFDGLVAIEGGKSTASGELFNDIPDRISDPLILIAVGYAVSSIPYAVELGWLAGILSILTAYIRNLSVSIGAPADFQGPMAKQQRMAIITIACVFCVIEAFVWSSQYSLFVALVIVVIGSLVTCINRTLRAYNSLENP